jgi:elongation factor 1-alpha
LATASCSCRVFTIERHYRSVDQALTGDNIGMKIKGLDKNSLPRTGDIMVKASEQTENPLGVCDSFTAQVSVLSHPGELKVGYAPIAMVRTSRSAIRLEEILWKVGKETAGTKVENPAGLKAGDVALVRFKPAQKLIVEKFGACEGLARLAIMEGTNVVMMAKVVDVVQASDGE